jgi:DNA polymerase-4
MARLDTMTPWVEQISIDEAFLDVSDLPEPGEALARQVQTSIRSELDLPCSLGVATNKLVAKIATNVGKSSSRTGASPQAILVVPAGQEAAFLAPLPAEALWGVGPKMAVRLGELGLRTIGDIARWPQESLVRHFGKMGHELARRAHGIDDSPVITQHVEKSVSQETTFAHDVGDGETLRRTLLHQSEGVGRRLRRSGLAGTTVSLKLRWPDFSTFTRQTTLPWPTNQDDEIHAAAVRLLEGVWRIGSPVRLIGVGVSGLGPPLRQLGLWETDSDKGQRLQETLDTLRERYGNKAVRRASDLE